MREEEEKSDPCFQHHFLQTGKEQWRKGKSDGEGYFILESHSEMPKVITGISESGLEIKGNITLRLITS